MNRPQKVRQVYTELKAVLGNTMSPSDLLECAWLFVSSAEGNDIRPRHDLRMGRIPFEELSLDVLYEKWGWKLVCQEFHAEESYTPVERPEVLIDQLLQHAA